MTEKCKGKVFQLKHYRTALDGAKGITNPFRTIEVTSCNHMMVVRPSHEEILAVERGSVVKESLEIDDRVPGARENHLTPPGV